MIARNESDTMHISRVAQHEVQREIFLNAKIYAQTLATVSAGAPPPHPRSWAESPCVLGFPVPRAAATILVAIMVAKHEGGKATI